MEQAVRTSVNMKTTAHLAVASAEDRGAAAAEALLLQHRRSAGLELSFYDAQVRTAFYDRIESLRTVYEPVTNSRQLPFRK